MAVATAGYGYFESDWLKLSRQEISIGPVGASPVKLLHLADLHASNFFPLDRIQEAIDLGLAERPDFICLTGDFINSTLEDKEDYIRLLSRLSITAPTYASLGNHDGGHWSAHRKGYSTPEPVCDLLAAAKIRLLRNSGEQVTVGKRTFRLIGLGDPWANDFDAKKAFASVPNNGEPTIVLSHNPDTKDDLVNYKWELMLSGHTHGGEVSIPLLGEPFAPVKDKRFIAGLYFWNNRWLYITKGIGSVLHMRFNCRPEVSLLTLT